MCNSKTNKRITNAIRQNGMESGKVNVYWRDISRFSKKIDKKRNIGKCISKTIKDKIISQKRRSRVKGRS